MQAIVQDTYGTADVLELREVDVPATGTDEVLIRVRAASIDRGVSHLMTGLPYPIRAMGYGLRAPKNAIRGRELAGVIESVGADVTSFRPGDEVFGIGEGTFATYAVARADKLALKPAGVSFEQAAALSISALTALQAVRDHAKVVAGQRVLDIGASGGVGSFAVQIAKAYGAEVTGVCSTAKVDLVRSLGADHVIDYTTSTFADGSETFDAIIDTGGNTSLSRLRRALTPNGTLVIVGGETGGRLLGGFERGLSAMARSPFTGQSLKAMMCSENADDLASLADLAASGAITPAIDRAYPLAQTADAIRRMEQGSVRGKVVVTV
jgi:NADPH:quinone reductase-like Zn-dependent oxidoreductase